MNALFCQKAKLGAVDALLNDSLAAKSLNPRPQGQGVTIWLGLRTRVRFRIPPPFTKTKAAKEYHLAAFFIGKSGNYTAGVDKGNH